MDLLFKRETEIKKETEKERGIWDLCVSRKLESQWWGRRQKSPYLQFSISGECLFFATVRLLFDVETASFDQAVLQKKQIKT